MFHFVSKKKKKIMRTFLLCWNFRHEIYLYCLYTVNILYYSTVGIVFFFFRKRSCDHI